MAGHSKEVDNEEWCAGDGGAVYSYSAASWW